MRAGQEFADRYRLEERLGRGGMGEVWRAHDRVLDREVAVKVVLAGWSSGSDRERAMARFRREIAATVQLDHPAITAVLDSGEHDGHPFLVLELIAGEDLTAVLARHHDGMPVGEVLAIGRQIAEGLAAAHAAGIVHRDVKPANVMAVKTADARWVAGPDGVIEPVTEPPGWRVKICDFGIAWLDGATAGLSTTRTRLGTLAYTSPEQIENQPVDGRADLYALGCTLFELLTGRTPFPTDDPLALMAMHLVADPPSARSLRPKIPEYLDRYLRGLLAKAPDERPGDAAAVARTFGALLRNEKVTATLVGTLRGHKGGVTALAFGPDGTLLATAASDGKIRLWDTATGRGAAGRGAHSVPAGVLAFDPDGELLACGSRKNAVYVWDPAADQVDASMLSHTDQVTSAALAPGCALLATGSRYGTVRLWDPVTGRDVATLTGHTSYVDVVVFDLDGARLASAGVGGVVRLWDAVTGETLATLTGHDAPVGALAFSPGGALLAGGGGEHSVWLWNVPAGETAAVLAGHTDDVTALAFSPDGTLLASGGKDGTVRLWDPVTGQAVTTLTGPDSEVTTVAFGPDGRLLVAGDGDGAVRTWAIDVGAPASVRPWAVSRRHHAKPAEEEVALKQAVLDCARRLGSDHSRTLEARFRLAYHRGVDGRDPAGALAMFEDLLAHRQRVQGPEHADTLRTRHAVVYWGLKAGRTTGGGAVAVYTELLADFLSALDADDDATLRVRRDLASARLREGDTAGAAADYTDLLADCTRVLGAEHPDTRFVRRALAGAVGRSGDAARAVTILEDLLADCTRVLGPDHAETLLVRRRLAYWHGAAGDVARAVSEHAELVADCSRVLGRDHPETLAIDEDLEYWQAHAGARLAEERPFTSPGLTGSGPVIEDGDVITATHGGLIEALAFSPDGAMLVSAGVDFAIRWWDPATGRPLGALTEQYAVGYFHELRFSPDGGLLASGNWDGNVWLWDLAGGRATAVMGRPSLAGRLRHLGTVAASISHTDHADSVTFSPDGRLLASGGGDGHVKIWNPVTRRLVTSFAAHPYRVFSVAFSPDGTLLASGGIGDDVRLWDPATGRPGGRLHGHTRPVTSVVFSPDGTRLASCGWDGTVRLWDPYAVAAGGTLLGHTDDVMALAFSPDGALLASAGEDGTVRLWDPATGRALATLTDHTEGVRAVTFSPDGRLLASGGTDRTIRIRRVAGLV
ncbi:protein kinase domain-containing protein [Actinomadura scrupuli]|uniref:WD40 repeat domain-containing serine/threonine protein kinase n=1 Tax=Actinomadura scrupuli TaxID=559629 RepID=UPI003D970472